MPQQIKIVNIDKNGQLTDDYGVLLTPPKGWDFLPAGDAGITRKVTANGDCWRVVFKKGRRTMSKGIWASARIIEAAKNEMESKRSTETYQKQKVYNAERREKKQQAYEVEFNIAVEKFLHFHLKYQSIAKAMSILVTQHAIPVGSGTVARTAMIPIEERASRAVIAWMRHQTTAYDNMKIDRIKGERRAVRRMLAEKSTQLLNTYRKGLPIAIHCPLKKALEQMIQKQSI